MRPMFLSNLMTGERLQRTFQCCPCPTSDVLPQFCLIGRRQKKRMRREDAKQKPEATSRRWESSLNFRLPKKRAIHSAGVWFWDWKRIEAKVRDRMGGCQGKRWAHLGSLKPPLGPPWSTLAHLGPPWSTLNTFEYIVDLSVGHNQLTTRAYNH